jgi:transcriptional regulator with XRE-family HTH domain
MRAIQRFGKQLQRLRTRRGLTQELAKTTGTFSISRRLPGSSDRSETALRHLRSVLGKGLRDQGEKNHR